MKPVIGITMGDPSGIGPEIIVKALLHEEVYKHCRPLVVGDARIMEKISDLLGLGCRIHEITDVKDAAFEAGTVDVFHLDCFRGKLHL
ncbi:MAG: hypothetical protein ACWGNV_13645 [Bacteroidales bacterium]